MMYRNQIVVVSVILIVVICMTMWCSCSTYIPYSESSVFSRQSAYEGFEEDGDGKKKKEEEDDDDDTFVNKVEGFESLLPAPYQQSELLDKFSQVPGSLDCKGYGYHNSHGPLCLTDELVTSLKTRGGNASGMANSMGN